MDDVGNFALGFIVGGFLVMAAAIYIAGAFHVISRAIEKRQRQRHLRQEWVRQKLADRQRR